MNAFNVRDFVPDPLATASDIERIKQQQYQNILTQRAIQDEEQSRSGYESAYNALLQQSRQQPVQPETVEPTEALSKLGYGDFQYTPEAQQTPPAQYIPPEGSSAAYLQGVNTANALFQKQQGDYYKEYTAPLFEILIKSGDDANKNKFIDKILASEHPAAGLSKHIASVMRDINISAPGKLDNVKMSPSVRAILSSMAPNEAVKMAIDSANDGDIFSVEMDQSGAIKKFGSPVPKTTGTRIIKRDVNGVPHNIMVGPDGEDIKDMGPAPVSGNRGNAPLSPAQEKSAAAYVRALREGRITLDKIPAYKGMRDRVMFLAEGGDSPSGEPISYTGDIAKAKSSAGSLAFVTKQYDMTKSFLGTIDSNIDQLKAHIADMSTRHNVDRGKIMNMGVREYLKRFEGDADINIYDMLVSAISTENAKLQSGGAGSVAQVAEGARTQMEKIHDSNMPIKEMLKLLEATRKEGGNRMGALEKQMKESGSRTERVVGSKDVPPQLIQAMQKEIKAKLSDKKVKAGDNVTFKWKDGKKYQVTIGSNGGFSGWKYVE